MKYFVLSVTLLLSNIAFCQSKEGKPIRKADQTTVIRTIEYDFLTETLIKPNSVKTGEVLKIVVKNINTLLYNVKFTVDQQDYTIPAAYSTPINFFSPPSSITSNNKDQSSKDIETKPETVNAKSEDVKEIQENLRQQNNKTTLKTERDSVKSIYKGLEKDYTVNSTISSELLSIIKSPEELQKVLDEYNNELRGVQDKIYRFQNEIEGLEALNTFNEKMLLLSASNSQEVYENRKTLFDQYWKQMYSQFTSNQPTDFLSVIDAYRGQLVYSLPQGLRQLQITIEAINNNSYYNALIKSNKREMNYKVLLESYNIMVNKLNSLRQKYIDSIYNLENRYIALQDSNIFIKRSKPITVLAKDYLNVTIKVTPAIQNIVFTRNLAPGDIGFRNLEESEYTFKIEAKNSWAINFSTGFVLNFGPKSESYSTRPYNSTGDTLIALKNRDNSFMGSVSYGGFIHFYKRSWREINWGGTFGVGLNSDLSNVSLLLGLSVLFGKSERIILSAGLNTYKVDLLKGRFSHNPISSGYLIPKSEAPQETTELVEKKYRAGFGVALTFNLTPRTRQ